MDYDVIIIGAGPAGLASGLYAGRARLKVLILEKLSCGGQVLLTEKIENYPGFSGEAASFDLMANMQKQVKDLGVDICTEQVVGIAKDGHLWYIKTDSKEYKAGAVIVAVGSVPKKLGLQKEELLTGKGISYCATCDGPLYRGKVVAVVGGGDTAVEEVLFLTRFADKVFLIHRRDRLRATEILSQRAKANKKIVFCWDSVIDKIVGEEKLEGLILENVKDKTKKELVCDGVFVYVGRSPDTQFLEDLAEVDEHGHIITDEHMRTGQAGLFAAGDCRKKILRQVVTAASDGAIAAFCAQQYLESLDEEK